MFRGNWRLIPAITVTSAALPRKKSRSLALDKALWNQPHCFMKLELKWKSLLALLLCAGSGGKSGSIPFSPSLVCCTRSEEHTSELQSRVDLVCRLLLEKKNNKQQKRQDRSQ